MSCGAGCRCGLDPTWLWLWRRPAATAPIGPLAGEPPGDMGVALKSEKKKKKPVFQLKAEYPFVKLFMFQLPMNE